MKKFYIILTLAFIISISAHAQKRNVGKINAKYDSMTVTGYPSDFEIITHNKVYNTSGYSQTYRWVVVSSNIPSSWTFAICDVNNCYANTDSQEFTLAAGDSGLFQVHFYPGGNTGTGTVVVYIYPVGEYSNGISLYSKGTIVPNSINNNSSVRIDFSMYPNPVKDYLDIRFTRKGNHSIEIYNILGRRILKKDIYNSDRMRISFENLQNGMYVVMYRAENGKVITKTISKE
ncbi:MAG TPA: T9SS type A sorting domain-containing protein [Bacteroidia bacterium]|nr:T9SS type A sorting domain-containing protein [Sphingobacteriales bacterium]HPD64579.1 T9SS type A sorting domain-containing protein [Bacteroidia bacterium]HRS58335.1 T9SS type A sorting domain-containing protein [Bacteroidia bacterium]HRU69018.1 T9SS type A sorting domain-containing protein [Bacteroidia bacterium]